MTRRERAPLSIYPSIYANLFVTHRCLSIYLQTYVQTQSHSPSSEARTAHTHVAATYRHDAARTRAAVYLSIYLRKSICDTSLSICLSTFIYTDIISLT